MDKFLIFGVLVALAGFVFSFFNKKGGVVEESGQELSFKKKPFLFDSFAELELFKILNELYGENYYIFTQINYSHLAIPEKSDWRKMRNARSRIDRKSADFVLCDKERVVPVLVIELDGPSHNLSQRKERDVFIDSLLKDIGLSIMHLEAGNLQKDYVKTEVDKVLGV